MNGKSSPNFIAWALGAYIAIAAWGDVTKARNGAISEVFSDALGWIGPALSGEPEALVVLTFYGMTALILFVAIPGRLGVFRMFVKQ
ncbi:hypothetical protein [Halorientalis regularis]|jgi:hypothetical protein|uniref:Uncharacterized protein n=1 Tax=Halorientalis regularis TaxID=660518 RepID=A0A1G7U1E6_9EURY|nr:hypothetical protein [Halorientalis regularis]SDG41174.1 hypothetical protein SAMN05216218_1352 [Halorientalis regularis]